MFASLTSFIKSILPNNKKRKFVIILGAGRCGTTYLVNELNKIPYINIYGENNLLFLKILEAINGIDVTVSRCELSTKSIDSLGAGAYKNMEYSGLEWYQNINKLKKMSRVLQKTLLNYFKDKHKITGFKEIRFYDTETVESLIHFEKIYNVFYIHLVRNLEEQSKSSFWKEKKDSKEIIEKVNNSIVKVLGGKNNYLKVDIKDISHDISVVKRFIGIND